MSNQSLYAISPIDGRYQSKTLELNNTFSEAALIRYRVQVELAWLEMLADTPEIRDISPFDNTTKTALQTILSDFDEQDVERVKRFESEINHDVKAIEYFLKEKCAAIPAISPHLEFIHFACTSEDVNNLAYALMVRDGCRVLSSCMDQLTHAIRDIAHGNADAAMLSRTHGQPASPTTMGKELANFVYRLERQSRQLNQVPLLGKINGAVGNYNAHGIAYPEVDWPVLAKTFIEQRLELDFNPYTTQIEPHDYMAELFDTTARFNTVLIDFCRDIWSYIAIGYFGQTLKQNEVGSSAMPHKVNPIDFENAEGNLGIANSLFSHFSEKLPVSRWQRDLSDSTVLRNIGVAFAHSLLAYKSCLRGLAKLRINRATMENDLQDNLEVLAEAIQTVMRRYQVPKPYELLKDLTRGQKLSLQQLTEFIDSLPLPDEVKQKLQSLRPHHYIGYAKKLAQDV